MKVQADDDGFLLDPDDWTEDLANEIADKEELELTKDRWNLVPLIRDYYYENGSVPDVRKILKQLKAELGPENAPVSMFMHYFHMVTDSKIIKLKE